MGDLRDVRSAAALPVPSIWADTLVHLLSTRLLLQPINATCRDTFCDSCCLQHRLSGYHRHLLIEYRTQRPPPQDTDLLGLESGVPPCPLLGSQDFNAVYGSIHPVPEVTILLGPVSGAPPRPLLGNRSCSTALPNSSDARSVAALPAQQYWAVPSVRFISAGFALQSTNAAYRGPICAINSTQPWLSVCRSHLLVDSDLERPVTEVEALLETASGVQLCFLIGGWSCRIRMEWRDLWDVRPAAVLPVLWTWVTTPVHLPSTRLHLQSPGTVCKAALLGTESGAPPCPLLGILCFRTVWQDSCNIRSVLAFPGLPLWSGFYISGYLWPWPSAYRHHLFVVFASMRPISQVPTLLRLVSGVPPRPCWVATLVRFSSIGFGVTPTGNPGGEPQWLRFAIRLQCRLHEREREGRSLLQQDVGRSMRRKARMAEPLLKWHRKRKLVRSRGRPRLKLSQKRNRLPGPVPSRRLKPKHGHCLRVRAALRPPRQNRPLLELGGPRVHEQLPVLVKPPPQAPLARRLPHPAIRPSLETMGALWRRGPARRLLQVSPLMMLRVWTARRSQIASTLLCCISMERCHPLRGPPRHLLLLRVRLHNAVRLGAHVGRRRCFAEQASDVRAILFLGRTAPTDIPSREIKYGVAPLCTCWQMPLPFHMSLYQCRLTCFLECSRPLTLWAGILGALATSACRRASCLDTSLIIRGPPLCPSMPAGLTVVRLGNRHNDPVINSGPSTLCCQGFLCHCSPVTLILDVAFEQPGRLLRMRCSAVCLILYFTLLLLMSLRVFLSNVCCQILRCTPVGVVLPWSNIEAGALNSARPVGQGRRRERSSKPRRRRQPNVRLVRQQLW